MTVPGMLQPRLLGPVLRPVTASMVCSWRFAAPPSQMTPNSSLLANAARTRWLVSRHCQHHKVSARKRVCAALQDTSDQFVDPAEYLADSLAAFQTSAGLVDQVSEDESEVDYLGESTVGNLHFVERGPRRDGAAVLGLSNMEDLYDATQDQLEAATSALLGNLGLQSFQYPEGRPERAIFCSRTLNLRAIQTIGYDLDYTLIHYDVNAWEGLVYQYGLESLRQAGCNVDGLTFDPDMVIRGLIIDKENGNLVKVDRFGYVKRAMHGTRMQSWSQIRDQYGRELVNLRNESRWVFLNTLFSVSEAVMYMQMVDRSDDGLVPPSVGAQTYPLLHDLVARAIFRTHVEGKLKAEIIKDPASYVERDPDMARTLLDQREAGKVLLLITNSDYVYTDTMMTYAYDPYLPEGRTWRDLFDMVIVQARKPDFWANSQPLYEVVTEDGLMRPAMTARKGGLYCGGSAVMVERALDLEGDDILYIGDHIYTDAALAKLRFRWRTALIVRELEEKRSERMNQYRNFECDVVFAECPRTLHSKRYEEKETIYETQFDGDDFGEQEVIALKEGRPHREKLKELMIKKEVVGDALNQLRLAKQRASFEGMPEGVSEDELNSTLAQLLIVLEYLDGVIGPMLERDGCHFNERWGYLSRAGLNDKSQFTRQIEKHADVYTSRVSNFLLYTPHQYFRSPSQSLAHDKDLSKVLM